MGRVRVLVLVVLLGCGGEESPTASFAPGTDAGLDVAVADDAPGAADSITGGGDDGGTNGPDTAADASTAPDLATHDAAWDTSADAPTDAGEAPEDALPPPENSCCETSQAPGCKDEGIAACVCAQVPVCCQEEWTGKCIEAATILCKAGCGGGGGGGGGGGADCGDGTCDTGETCETCPGDCGACPGTGDCCAAKGTPACESTEITNCVCAVDSYCCATAWDALCVQEAGTDCGAGCAVVDQCGDGTCGAGEGCDDCPADCGVCDPGDCCTARTTPGCGSAGIQSCVCEADPFCCATAWDNLCVIGAKDTCGASCEAPQGCGDGICGPTETCGTCPADCGPCGGDCCLPGPGPGCADAVIQSCVCAGDAFCCDTQWDDLCATAAKTCGAVCDGGCDCAWASGTCGPQTAMLEVVPRDVWAQPVAGKVEVTAGTAVSPLAGAVWTIPLCGKSSLSVTVSAALHDPLTGTLAYDGSATTSAMTFKPAPGAPKAAWALTTDLRTVGAKQVRFYTVHTGLAHHWFAPAGRPARPGTRVTLLRDGLQAWATVTADLSLAAERVMASSWWWTSELEVLRDPATHMFLSASDRWKNTIMGKLEALQGIDRRVMVNQFYSQDGLLSNLTVDDELLAKAKAPGDDFEYLGMANDVHGKFVVTPKAADFGARLKAVSGATQVASAPYPAFSGPIAVDTTALPLGVGWLDVPIASWHQKFMSIDAEVAFVGGMNFKTTDWDGSDHTVFNELRMQFKASTADRQKVKAKKKTPDFGPRKDYMMRLEGPAAVDVEDVFRERWLAQIAAGALYADLATPFAAGKPAPPKADGVQAQVVATMPAPFSENAILEALLRAVSRAEKYIFIEDQYFRAPLLMDKVTERMNQVPALVLIVVTNPMNEWADPGCWQTYLLNEKLAKAFPTRYRTYQTQSFDAVDTGCTFCIDEVDAHFVPHDLHSKMVLIDDVWMEVGSCNSNNRGLLYEGELAVVAYDPATVSKARDAVLSNIVGPDYPAGTPPSQLISLMDARAKKNQEVWDAWDKEGMDLNLNGAPLPAKYQPSGFLYPLTFGAPKDCFIENVGPDVM
ncbi:MAG: hypothetical protein AMXMBFR64_04170 [Myxococcales bacterium]